VRTVARGASALSLPRDRGRRVRTRRRWSRGEFRAQPGPDGLEPREDGRGDRRAVERRDDDPEARRVGRGPDGDDVARRERLVGREAGEGEGQETGHLTAETIGRVRAVGETAGATEETGIDPSSWRRT
jgi:hypothetical protein